MVMGPDKLSAGFDPHPEPYLPQAIPAAGVGMQGTPITCNVYAESPATQASQPVVVITNAIGQVTPVVLNPPPLPGNPMMLSFTIGDKAAETAGATNSISITVQDDTGAQTAFDPFFYYKLPAAPPLPPPPPPLPTQMDAPAEEAEGGKKKKKKKGKK
jgi:hypothetical protein